MESDSTLYTEINLQLQQIIGLLTDSGALIEVQVDRFTKDDPSTIFLVADLLPDEPCIERVNLFIILE
jgi:hypothetical protein